MPGLPGVALSHQYVVAAVAVRYFALQLKDLIVKELSLLNGLVLCIECLLVKLRKLLLLFVLHFLLLGLLRLIRLDLGDLWLTIPQTLMERVIPLFSVELVAELGRRHLSLTHEVLLALSWVPSHTFSFGLQLMLVIILIADGHLCDVDDIIVVLASEHFFKAVAVVALMICIAIHTWNLLRLNAHVGAST